MSSCDYTRRMDSRGITPVTSPGEQSPGRDTKSLPDHRGGRLQGKAAKVGKLLLGVHICFRVVERTKKCC